MSDDMVCYVYVIAWRGGEREGRGHLGDDVGS